MNNFINKYFTKRQSLFNLAFIFSGLIGAFLVAKFGLSIIWPVSGFAFFLSVFFLYFGEEVYEKKSLHVKESFKNMIKQTKESVSYSSKHHVLFLILIISFILAVFGVFNGFISWTPLLKSFNFPESSFGYIWSASGILGIIAPFLSNKILKKNKERNLLIFSSFVLLAYSILFITASTLAIIISLIILFYFIMDFSSPVERTYFHRFIPSKLRATVGGIESMIASIGGIIALPLAGFLVDKIGSRHAIFISGLLIIPVIILYFMMGKTKDKIY